MVYTVFDLFAFVGISLVSLAIIMGLTWVIEWIINGYNDDADIKWIMTSFLYAVTIAGFILYLRGV